MVTAEIVGVNVGLAGVQRELTDMIRSRPDGVNITMFEPVGMA